MTPEEHKRLGLEGKLTLDEANRSERAWAGCARLYLYMGLGMAAWLLYKCLT